MSVNGALSDITTTTTTHSIYFYSINIFKQITHEITDTCEDVCILICKELNLSPLVQLLFSLRICDTNYWLPGSNELSADTKYEFRLRFKIPKVSDLKILDKQAYTYFYHQVRHDVLHSKINEIEYPKYKDNILGLCVTDMYIEMIEQKCSIEYLSKNYKKYLPKKIYKNHPFFINSIINRSLRTIKKENHDPYYVKSLYLEGINKIAPNYLIEEYSGVTSYLREDELISGTCPVKIQFSPFHPEEAGLRVFYPYKNLWKHISKIEDIYAILVEGDTIKIEMKDEIHGYTIHMPNKQELQSLVSCISGYYRLMVKWSLDLCESFPSPSLRRLRELKCHGPIGGEYSYNKIQEKNNTIGSYIIRQCAKNYDNYFIDIVVTKERQPETFKITNYDNKWQLHTATDNIQYDDLLGVAKNLNENIKKMFRLAPSEYDKSPQLLLCLPVQQSTAKKAIGNLKEIREMRPLVINATNELLLYKDNQRDCIDGIFTTMRGEWLIPIDKKVEVTLKILKLDKLATHLNDFVNLVDKWAKIDSSEIVKLYGTTLNKPIAMVLESTKFGPFDLFLRTHEHIEIVCLVDAAYSLARALHYLQENKISHGRIRCCNLQVMKYESNNHIVVKLGDPGLLRNLTRKDIPWIPVEYHNVDVNHVESLIKNDPKAEIWAYATTLWEIFSRGIEMPDLDSSFFTHGRRLEPPKELDNLREIYKIMREGWETEPDRRFTTQDIFSRLIDARERSAHSYDQISTENGILKNPVVIGSKISVETNGTYISKDCSTYSGSDEEQSSTHSRYQSESDEYTLNSHTHYDNGSTATATTFLLPASMTDDSAIEYYENIPTAIEWKDCKIISQGRIGRGNYGSVYKGQIEDMQNNVQNVALKTFRPVSNNPSVVVDFQREAKIMKKLNHPNIVKILGYVEDSYTIIVMEYVRHGSFLMYLGYSGPELTTAMLLKFAKDIASGMEYLGSKKIIHRDLAARNILVDSDDCVKISDFGLAQYVENGYYRYQSNRALPIKWYAPETLENFEYSHKSDVWSYGVTLFEMFSRGKEPQLIPGRDLLGQEILKLLTDNKRLSRPDLCPNSIYDSMMMPCWDLIPQNRPNFTQLLVIINKFITEYGEIV